MSVQELLYPCLAILLGYTALGMTGFGSALIAVPLLAWRWPLHEAVALTLLLDVPAALLLGGLNWRQVSFGELRRLLPGVLVGALAGLWLSATLQARWPLLVLGIYVAAVGVQLLRATPHARQMAAARWSPVAGSVIGLVEMLFGTAGPLVLAWLSRRLTDLHVLRATTPVAIAASACLVLVAMGWAGRLSHSVLWLRWLTLLFVAACGVLLGNRIARSISPTVLRRLICMLLLISGLALMAHALRQS